MMTTQELRAMNPNEVRDARRALGLTQHELAVLLRMGGDGKRSVRRWEAGDRDISGPASVAIEALLTGSIDVTYVGPNPVINGYTRTKGADIRVLSGAARGGDI